MPSSGCQNGCSATFIWKEGVFFPQWGCRNPFLFKSAEKEMENEQKEKRIFLREMGSDGKKQGSSNPGADLQM